MSAQPSRDDFNADCNRHPAGAYPRARLQKPINGDVSEEYGHLGFSLLEHDTFNNFRLMEEINRERVKRGEPPIPIHYPATDNGQRRRLSDKPETEARKHAHYFKDVSKLTEVDVYRTCDLFQVDDASGAIQHAVKKLLLPGQRGAGKDRVKDLQEAIDTLQRKIEMMKEDAQ